MSNSMLASKRFGRRFHAHTILIFLDVDISLNFLRRRTVKRNLAFLLSLAVLTSMILSACGGAVPAASSSGTAIITFVQQPTTLNPLYANQWFSTITTQFWLKSLWSFDQNNSPVPE